MHGKLLYNSCFSQVYSSKESSQDCMNMIKVVLKKMFCFMQLSYILLFACLAFLSSHIPVICCGIAEE